MIHDWQRMAAIVLLSLLGAGIIYVLVMIVSGAGLTKESAGWATAGFLSLREIFSKVEKIALGTPAVSAMGEEN